MLSIADLKLREGGNMVAKHFEGATASVANPKKCLTLANLLGIPKKITRRFPRETVAKIPKIPSLSEGFFFGLQVFFTALNS